MQHCVNAGIEVADCDLIILFPSTFLLHPLKVIIQLFLQETTLPR